MTITKTLFGKADGKNVDLYTLTNGNDTLPRWPPTGPRWSLWRRPTGTASWPTSSWASTTSTGISPGAAYFGSTVGRVANRIRNGAFELDGRRFAVATNNGTHHLHGGIKGWDKVVWTAEAMDTADGPALRAHLRLAATARRGTRAQSPPAAYVHAHLEERAAGGDGAPPTNGPRWSHWRTTATGTWAGTTPAPSPSTS